SADIDLDAVRDRVGQATHFDGMRNNADGAAALDAGRLIGAAHADRDIDPDRGALAQAHEIHVQRDVAHRIELEITRNDAVLHAVHLDLMDGREEAAGIDALAQIGIVERNRQRRLAVAIDDSGYAAGATLGPGGPLACPRACRRLDLIDTRHRIYPRLKPCNAKEIPRQPPGVPVMPRGWRAYNGAARGKQGNATTT